MKYKAQKRPDGAYDIYDFDIFKLDADDRTRENTLDWFDNVALKNFNDDKSRDYRPIAHIGHTEEGDKTERPRIGFVDNLRRKGNVVYCDLTGIPEAAFEIIKDGQYPNRSVELWPHRYKSVALLGAREPHFRLPSMEGVELTQFKAIESAEEVKVVKYDGESDMTIEEIVKQDEIRSDLWDIDWALDKKILAIMDDKTLTAEDKKAKCAAAIDEHASLVKAKMAEMLAIAPATPPAADTLSAEQSEFLKRFRAENDRLKKEIDWLRGLKTVEFTQRLTEAGLSIPVIDNYMALRGALNTFSALWTDQKPAPVKFTADGKTRDLSPLEAADAFMADLCQRFSAGNLFVPKGELPKPFKPKAPEITGNQKPDQITNLDLLKEIESYAAEHQCSADQARREVETARRFE